MNDLSVTLVTQWYPPESVAQPQWIARALASAGVEMRVLTGIPNYPTGDVPTGYRAWRGVGEEVDGLAVTRTPLYPSHDRSALRRIANYVSWAISSAVLGQRSLRDVDVALVYSSPATAALPAMIARRRYGTPYVLLIQDVWPDSIFAAGFLQGAVGRLAEKCVTWFVNRAYRGAAEIAVISPGMIDLLVARGVPREKITLIYNWVDQPDDHPVESADLRKVLGIGPDEFVLLYAGNHGAAQGLEPVVQAFAAPSVPARGHLVLVGDGVSKPALRELAERTGADRVHFVDPVAHSEVARLVSEADAQLVSLRSDPLFAATMPSKLQAILAAGKPALVVAPGDAAAVVADAGAGVTAPPGDVVAIDAAVRQLVQTDPAELRRMGGAGRDLYMAEMSEQVGARRLMDLLVRARAKRHTERTQK